MKHLVTFATNQPLEASAEVVAPAVGLGIEQMARVWWDIASKRRATNYLRCPPRLIGRVLTHNQIRSN